MFTSEEVEDTTTESGGDGRGTTDGADLKLNRLVGYRQAPESPTGSTAATKGGAGDWRRRRSRNEATYSPFDHHSHEESSTHSSSKNGSTLTAGDRGAFPKAALFAFDIPEHLPSSPICPAHPKNKSKGKGVCVVSP